MPSLTPWRMVANYAQMSSQLLLRSGVQEGIVSLKELVGRKDLSLLTEATPVLQTGAATRICLTGCKCGRTHVCSHHYISV
jgi:hypothetical protein